MNEIVEVFDEITDNIIALSVVGAGIAAMFLAVSVPEWFYLGFGMIITHFFEKKRRTETKDEANKRTNDDN